MGAAAYRAIHREAHERAGSLSCYRRPVLGRAMTSLSALAPSPSLLPATALEVRVRAKHYAAVGAAAARTVLGDLAFTCAAGSFTAITGPSGIGKTTLLNLVAGLDASFEGMVETPPTT